MGSVTSLACRFAARAGVAALTLPMLFGGAVSAPAAVVSHVMVPSVGQTVRYDYAGTAAASGQIRFGCQTRPHDLSKGVFCYGPDQIRAAYDIQPVLDSGITGHERTIVIIDAFQSPTITQDLALFDQVWGLPDPKFTIIAPQGLTPFDATDGNQVGWSAEISLDVQWAHAVAPGANIDLVLSKDNQDQNILAVTKYAIDHNLGDVISQSFGEGESCMDPKLVRQQNELFSRAVRKGITLLASSGDQGAAQPTCDGTSYFLSASTPASDPNVTGVGGTHLEADATSGAYSSESVWNDSFGAGGGGFSTLYQRPYYQRGFVQGHARGVPDVAYNGDVVGGVVAAWGVPFGVGAFFIFGGTSAGSPQWAGIVALSDQSRGERLGALNPRFYALKHTGEGDNHKVLTTPAFHDITVGNNTFTGLDVNNNPVTVNGFAASAGWDAASGLGTPDVAKLLKLLGDES